MTFAQTRIIKTGPGAFGLEIFEDGKVAVITELAEYLRFDTVRAAHSHFLRVHKLHAHACYYNILNALVDYL